MNGDKHPLFDIIETSSLNAAKLKEIVNTFATDWSVNPFFYNSDAHEVNGSYMNNAFIADYPEGLCMKDVLHRVNRMIV